VRQLADLIDRPVYRSGPPTWAAIRRDLRLFWRTGWRMTLKRPELARHFWPAFVYCARKNPAALQVLVMNMVIYLHVRPFSRHVVQVLERRIGEIETGAWAEPEVIQPGATGIAA
jgi:hypothetical protein